MVNNGPIGNVNMVILIIDRFTHLRVVRNARSILYIECHLVIMVLHE